MSRNLTLKEIVQDKEMVEKISRAFADLRADFELSLEASAEKIVELEETHIDVKDHLGSLINATGSSSGVVEGLRGTGKTHLFLLARDSINKDISRDSGLVVYINVKKLTLPDEFNQEIFNRIFSGFLIGSIIEQLKILINRKGNFQRAISSLSPFTFDEISRIKGAIEKLLEMKPAIIAGTSYLENIRTGQIKTQKQFKELTDAFNKVAANFSSKPNLKIEFGERDSIENSGLDETINEYISFLDIQSISSAIKEIISILKIKSITFYVDEWEKLYYAKGAQKSLATYINAMIDNPIYFWIAYVPFRGSLEPLSRGNDLQHTINLDENLIYEIDKQTCVEYFTKFINKRLEQKLGSKNVDVKKLINKRENLELLIMGSMGNPRDFGTIFLNSWNQFVSYRSGKLDKGRPFQYISAAMIKSAIRADGENKLKNINDDILAQSAWKDLEVFSTEKETSHIAIEETKENEIALKEPDFSNLIYQRLFHKRKGQVRPKDSNVGSSLSIYALSFSATYDHHQKDKKYSFITDYEGSRDKTRRFIYSPSHLVQKRKIQDGELFPCQSCGEEINPTKMKAAWEKNICPFCGNEIYSKSNNSIIT